ncbi:hypothetical protein [Listeria fleischmannii]|uniref:hypothetical protein n=1 Tax=Listeria fleischmannii TaxID=1069827 RepID=UPI001625D5CB|nr:hypothetical protein [Listeria fleischmannii]MBC1419908.1 hypothetical protein [Listeria fleischmannii]
MKRLEKKYLKIFLVTLGLFLLVISIIVFVNGTKLIDYFQFTKLESQEVITVPINNSRSNQKESYSTITIENPEGAKLKLTASGASKSSETYWKEVEPNVILYDMQKNIGIQSIEKNNTITERIIPNDKNNEVYIENDGIIIQYAGKKTFKFYENPFEVKIRNISNNTTKINTYIEYH